MNGDKSARAIDPLVKAPLRLQPNVLKKKKHQPQLGLWERQSSSDETHLTHNTEWINRELMDMVIQYICIHYRQKARKTLQFEKYKNIIEILWEVFFKSKNRNKIDQTFYFSTDV